MAVSKAKDEPDIIDDDDVEEMREELLRSAAEVEKLRKAYISERDENARLREQSSHREETRRGRDGNEEQHVIDFWGRLQRAWRYPNFRLFVFMAAVFGNAVYGAKFLLILASLGHGGYAAKVAEYGPRALTALCIAFFLLWSFGQFHKRGLAQLLLKWAVFFAAVLACDLVGGELAGWGNDWRAIAGGLAVVMVLTFTKISEWLGRQICLRVWDTRPVAIVKGWF